MNIRSTRGRLIAVSTAMVMTTSMAVAVPTPAIAASNCGSWVNVPMRRHNGGPGVGPRVETRSCLAYNPDNRNNIASVQVRSSWYTNVGRLSSSATLHWCQGGGITVRSASTTWRNVPSMHEHTGARTTPYSTGALTMARGRAVSIYLETYGGIGWSNTVGVSTVSNCG